jgi:DNA ligase-1
MVTNTFDQLYGLDKANRIRTWIASVEEDSEGNGVVTIQHGLLDGALQTETRVVSEGKNIGKRNETTPFQQAISETERRWKNKVEKESYSTNVETLQSGGASASEGNMTKFFPMLAGTMITTPGKKNSVEFPCFVQPKLDGLRCVIFRQSSDGVIVTQSRTGSFFSTMGHITKELTKFFNTNPHIVLDGELFTFDIPFETLAGLIKKEKVSIEDQTKLLNVKYHVYDMINVNDLQLSYKLRKKYLATHFRTGYNHISLVDTKVATDMDEFKEYFSEYVGDGYEGIMARKLEGKYLLNGRSNDLLKYKEFMENEYKITGFKEGTGRDTGTIIWECETPEGKVFNVRPQGSIEYRRELFDNGETYIGKLLTVKYQELSEQKVPRFPVGKAIRDGY